jgi:2'-5' RNA ligase
VSQLSFDLGGPEPLPAEDPDAPNLFFALRPPVEVGAEAIAVASDISHREGFKAPRPASVLHLTLCKIGHYGRSERVIEMARGVGDAIVANPFRVVLTRLMHFQGSGAVVFASDQTPPDLSALNADLVRALRREGFKPASGFKPHMTFVYERGFLVAETLLANPIAWEACEFELVSSPPGETRHEVLGRWDLT